MMTLFVIAKLFMAFWMGLLAIVTALKVLGEFGSPTGFSSRFRLRPSWKVLAVTAVIAGGLVALSPVLL